MRVLHIAAEITDDGNGLAEFVRRLSEAQAALGDKPAALTHAGPCDFQARQPRRPNPLYFSRGFGPKADALCREADFVHIHGCWTFPVWRAAEAARLAGVPYAVSPHGSFDPVRLAHSAWKKSLAAPFDRRVCRNASLLLATSADEAAWIRAFVRRPGAPVPVVPCGVAQPPPWAAAKRAAASNRLLYLGRLHPLKGVDLLLEAFAASGAADEGATLTICGRDEGGTLARLRRQAAELGAGGSVTFLPPVSGDAKWRLIADCDCLVLPSRSENFGIVVGEALACGRPAIATASTPWRELAQEACVLCPDATPQGLAAALVQFLAMPPAERAAMGARGQAAVRRRFSWAEAARRLRGLYASCLPCESPAPKGPAQICEAP